VSVVRFRPWPPKITYDHLVSGHFRHVPFVCRQIDVGATRAGRSAVGSVNPERPWPLFGQRQGDQMNKYAKYSTVIMSVGVYGVVALREHHDHIEQSNDTAPVQTGRLIYAVATSSASSSQMPLIINRPARR
jgi:hypothetical protein